MCLLRRPERGGLERVKIRGITSMVIDGKYEPRELTDAHTKCS